MTVLIAGVVCTIRSLDSNTIECRTGSHRQSSIKALVQVYTSGIGNSINVKY